MELEDQYGRRVERSMKEKDKVMGKDRKLGLTFTLDQTGTTWEVLSLW